ncbi:MAG: hypothetical protein MUC77_04555 [Chromatiaceae bacterium]|jgi:hypothetical protein|nr:hypothetical protein [Chromatiaceae bacterium]
MNDADRAENEMLKAELAQLAAARHGRPSWSRADQVQAMRDGLRARYRLPTRDPHPAADTSGNYSLIEAARTAVEIATGRPVQPAGDGFSTVINALATADFPSVVSEVMQALAVSRRSAILPDLLAVTARVELSDYRETAFSTVDLGELPAPSKATTGAFWTIKPRASAEKVQLWSLFARLLISRQALANDDMNFIPSAIGSFAHAAHRSEMKALATLLEANAALEDGTALFHATRGNLTVATLDASGLGVIFATMREQTSESGLASCAKCHALVIHPDDEIGASILVQTLPETARPKIVVNPFLASNASWYAVADPVSFPALGRIVLTGSDSSAIAVSSPEPARERTADGTIVEYPGIAVPLTHSVGHRVLSPVGVAKFTKT